jgi:Tfp pilus assembly protein PilF
MLMDKKSGPAAEHRPVANPEQLLVAYALATAFLNLGDTAKAQAIFKQLTEATNNSTSVHIMIGRAYQNAGKKDDAAVRFNRAAEIDAKGSRV